MKKTTLLSTALLAILSTSHVFADCSTEQTICEAKCAVTYLTDDAAELGCKSKCVAKRALCSTESGAKTVVESGGDVVDKGVEVGGDVVDKSVEISKDAWDNTKSFFKGVTE